MTNAQRWALIDAIDACLDTDEDSPYPMSDEYAARLLERRNALLDDLEF